MKSHFGMSNKKSSGTVSSDGFDGLSTGSKQYRCDSQGSNPANILGCIENRTYFAKKNRWTFRTVHFIKFCPKSDLNV